MRYYLSFLFLLLAGFSLSAQEFLPDKKFAETSFPEVINEKKIPEFPVPTAVKSVPKGGSAVACNVQDSLALVALYNATNGDNWTNNSGWLTDSVYKWYGIILNSEGRVYWIDLTGNNLSGAIPPEIGNLTKLETLYLMTNSLTGSIPSEIGQLANLNILALGANQLSGKIPSEIEQLNNLTYLGLECNNFSQADIPDGVWNLTNLTSLGLCGCGLDSVPEKIGALSKMQFLDLNNNNLDSLPSSMSKLTNLIQLYLRNNDLTVIPKFLDSLVSLTALDLEGNKISKIECTLEKLTSLTFLKLAYNKLVFSELEKIAIDINSIQVHSYSPQANVELYADTNLNLNSITLAVKLESNDNTYQWYKDGSVIEGATDSVYTISLNDASTYYCEIKNSKFPELTLHSNAINTVNGISKSEYDALVALYNATNGDNWTNNDNWLSDKPVSEWYGITTNGSHIISIYLPNNKLSGSLPPEIGNLTNLQYLYLYYNQLSGTLPAEIGNLTNLRVLFLYNNRLSGSLPKEIGNLTNLVSIALSDNELSGGVPAELDNLTNLQYLYLYNNNLDTIECTLANLPLTTFEIQNNNFNFGDLDNIVPDIDTIATHTYAPQKSVELWIDTLTATNEIKLSVKIYSSGNTYQWYKNDIAIDGATDSVYTIPLGDGSIYYCEIKNFKYPELTLYSDAINTVNGVTKTEYDALVALYNATGGDNWINNDNWLSDKPVSQWYGITTNGSHVVAIKLDKNNLSGTLPAEIGDLTYLQDLYLGQNNLTGTLPAEMSNLKQLKNLGLYYNSFSGDFPACIADMDSLEYVSMGSNNFSGAVPSEIINLPKLQKFYVYKNHFDQLPAFPDGKLSRLWVSENNFDFGDLEPNVNSAATYNYSPQANIGDTTFISMDMGQDYTLTMNAGGTATHYQWYKDGTAIDGATNSTYTISGATEADAGQYWCVATNDKLPNLTLTSNPFYLSTQKYTVTFIVTDDNGPIKEATINVAGQTLTTGADGKASIELPNGSYTAEISKNGYISTTKAFSVNNSEISLEIILKLKTYLVTFNVTNGSSPVEGATISVANQTLTTGADGKASVELSNGDYTALIRKTGYNDYTKDFTVNNSDLTLDIVLSNQQYTVTFSVTDGSAPVEGANIAVNGKVLTTGADGKASIELPNGDYTAIITKNGYLTVTKNFTVSSAALSLEIAMRMQTFSVTFNVTDGSSPIEGATISVDGQALTTDADGKASIDLVNGDYTAITTRDGFVSDTTQFTVSDADVNVNITLKKTSTGVDDLENIISIYPNPSNGMFVLKTNEEIVQIKIYSANGREQQFIWNRATNEITLRNSGIYILKVTLYGGKHITKKLIVK